MCVLEVTIFSSTYLLKIFYNNFFLKFVSQNGSTISTPFGVGGEGKEAIPQKFYFGSPKSICLIKLFLILFNIVEITLMGMLSPFVIL